MLKMEITRDMTCRVCLSEKSSLKSIFLINPEGNSKTFAAMIEECTPIKICIGDGLPEVICQDCMDMLKISYGFKILCEKSDLILKEYLTNGKIEEHAEHLIEYVNENNNEEYDEVFTQEYVEDSTVKHIGNHIKNMQIEETNCYVMKQEELSNKSKKQTKLNEKIIYNCKECDQVFEKVSQFNKHLKLHSKECSCSMCDVIFSDLKSLNNHMRLVHKFYMCKLCDRKFRSRHGLKYHIGVFHNGVKAFQCSKCDKRFGLKQALIKHEILHTDEKNYLCTLCGKAYATSDSLHYHLRHHEGERPHLCTHCGKTFIQACHLKNHMWTHTGIKPHICKTCGKCYTSAHQLKKHWKKYCGNMSVNEDSKTVIKNEFSNESVFIVGVDCPGGNFTFNLI